MNKGLRDRLEDWDGSFPRSWKPRAGSIITGTVVRYDVGPTQWGERHICVVEEDETGDLVGIWLSHTVLLDEFKTKRPAPGEKVGVKRLEDSSKGYARYVVLVEGREEDVPDFGELGEPGDVDPKDKRDLLDSVRDEALQDTAPIGEPTGDLPF